MNPLTLAAATHSLLAPTVVAAVVSGVALLVRELVGRKGQATRLRHERRRFEEEFSLQGQEALLKQVQALWSENATLKACEAELRSRCRLLERTCSDLERQNRSLESQIDRLRRRLDRDDRLIAQPVSPQAASAASSL